MDCTVWQKAYCTLWNGTLRNETKWNLYFAKWKFVLCELDNCTLQNGKLHFAKWKTALCKMKICTLQNGNLYFVKWDSYSVISWKLLWRSLCEPTILLQSWPRHTYFCCGGRGGWVLNSSLTATKGISNMVSWERRSQKLGQQTHKTYTLWVSRKVTPKKEDNFSIACLPQIASKHLVYKS